MRAITHPPRTAVIECLEDRKLFDADPSVDTIVIFATAGNDNLSIHVSEYSDTRTVAWTLNGVHKQLHSPFYERIVIVDPAGSDKYEVGGGPIGVEFEIYSASGNDQLKTTASLRGRIKFHAGTGSDSVLIEQTYHDDPEKMKIDADRIAWSPARYVSAESVERIEVRGSDVNDEFDVGYVRSDQQVYIKAGKGNDKIVVGRGDMDSNLYGRLSVDGQSGTDTIIFHDTDDTGSDSYRLQATQVTKPIMMTYPVSISAEKIDLLANRYSNQIDVRSSAASLLRIFGNKGDDKISIGAGDLETVGKSNIEIDGGAGSDKLVIDDSLDAASRRHIVTATTYSRSFARSMKLANLDKIDLRAGLGNDFISAQTAKAAYGTLQLRISGGHGNDTIYGSATADQLFGGAGDDTLFGMEGNDGLYGEAGTDLLDGGPGEDVKVQ